MVSRKKSLFLYNVEKIIKDKNKSYPSRAVCLLNAWDQLHQFLKNCSFQDADVAEEVVHSAYRLTLQFILHGEWAKLSPDVTSRLGPAVRECIPLIAKFKSDSMLKECESVLNILENAWSHPILTKILQNSSVSDEEVVSFLSSEGCEVLIMRLEMLCENKCEDFALRLVEKSLQYAHIFERRSAGVSKSKHDSLKDIAFLKDMRLSLLYLNNRNREIVTEAKNLNLKDGLVMVRRYSRCFSRDELIYKQNFAVCELIAHTVLTTALLKSVEEDADQKVLFALVKEWLFVLRQKSPKLSDFGEMITMMLKSADSSIHIYMFCRALKDFDNRYKALCIELFIRGITTNMNEVEYFKINSDHESLRRSKERLSCGFLQLADLLKDKLIICRECVLTAFSVNPTTYMLNLVKELAFLSGFCSECDLTELDAAAIEISKKLNSLMCSTRRGGEILNVKSLYSRYLNGNSNAAANADSINMFDSDLLELPPQLCDDLTTILNSPRNTTLSWTLEWDDLKSKCESYLDEFNKTNIKRSESLRCTMEQRTQPCSSINQSDCSYKSPILCQPGESEDLRNASDGKFSNKNEDSHNDLNIDYYNLKGADLARYLSTVNINPRVVIKKLTKADFIKHKIHFKNFNIFQKCTAPSFKKSSRGTKKNHTTFLEQSVPGLNSLDMIIPAAQESTVNVVQVSNSSSQIGQSSGSNDNHDTNPDRTKHASSSSSNFDNETSVEGPPASDRIISLSSLLQSSQCSSKSKLMSTSSWSHVLHVTAAHKPENPSEGVSTSDSSPSSIVNLLSTQNDQDEVSASSDEKKIQTESRASSRKGQSTGKNSRIVVNDENESCSNSFQAIKSESCDKSCSSGEKVVENSLSLPKFQQAFGRQVYQLSKSNESTVVSRGNSTHESNLEIKETSLSKAIQTVSNEIEEADKCLNASENTNIFVPSSSVSNSSIVTQTENLTCKTDTSDGPSSSGVIYTYKMPSSIHMKSQLNKKSADVMAKSQKDDCIQPSTAKTKDTVIRSGMNVLLTAALRPSNPSVPCQTKLKMNTSIKKPLKRCQNIQTSSSHRIVKPNTQTSLVNNVCQTDQSSIVTLPSSLSGVQIMSGEIDTDVPQSLSDLDRRKVVPHQSVESSAVSSTTLELQIREFESVLEQVTNTSQMKEKVSKQDNLEESDVEPSDKQSPSDDDMDASDSFVNTSIDDSSSCNSAFSSLPSSSASSLITAPKMHGTTTPVVVVQSCSRPISSPVLGGGSLNPESPQPCSNNGASKLNTKLNKSKSKSVGKTASPTNTIKVSNLPKPQQKPQEDEQTTQRIYAILDKYAEQLRNSPELKNKPAPRRRSNPPSNPSNSSKRKKSSQSKAKSGTNTSSSGVELSPTSEDVPTLGSEDSSNGVSQISQTVNSPQNQEDLSSPSIGETSSEPVDSKESKSQQIVLTEPISNPGRAVIVQDNLQSSVINVDNAKIISGKPVVVGNSNTVPLTLSLPGGGNVKQVIFPVPTDGRQVVVAKVPKMYRVTVPGGSPILTTSPGGTVVLRQMCLNKGTSTLKPVKVPVMSTTLSSTNISNLASQSTVVLPSGSQAFPISSNTFSEAFGVSLDSSIMLNNQTGNVNFLSTKRGSKGNQDSTQILCGVSSMNNLKDKSLDTVEIKNSSVIVPNQEASSKKLSSSEAKVTKILPDANKLLRDSLSNPKLSAVDASGLSSLKSWSQVLSDGKKEEVKDKGCDKDVKSDSEVSVINVDFSDITSSKNYEKSWEGEMKLRKDSFSVICSSETVIKTASFDDSEVSDVDKSVVNQVDASDNWCSNIKSEFEAKSLVSEVTRGACSQTLFYSRSRMKDKNKASESPIFNAAFKRNEKYKSCKSEDAIQSRIISNYEKELRLHKSLSEECEDLGVDKPSTSDLFPEAELILDPDPLSRDSIGGEFSRSIDSSSSSHDSPCRSPIFGNKGSSILLKQKRPLGKRISKSKENNSKTNKSLEGLINKDKLNNSFMNALTNNPKIKRCSFQNYMKFSPKAKLTLDIKSTGSETFSDDIDEMSELDDHSESLNTPCSDADSDSNQGKKCDPVASCIKYSISTDTQVGDIEDKLNSDSTLLCGQSMDKNRHFQSYLSGKNSFKYDCGGLMKYDSVGWYQSKKVGSSSPCGSIDAEILAGVGNNDDSEIDSTLESRNSAGSEDTCQMEADEITTSGSPDTSHLQLHCKRKSMSNLKSFSHSKVRKLDKMPLTDSTDDSESSIDALIDSGSCHRDIITRRSSTRGLIKKGCPCQENESSALKRKGKECILKTDKTYSGSSLSMALVNKKVHKSFKGISKKR